MKVFRVQMKAVVGEGRPYDRICVAVVDKRLGEKGEAGLDSVKKML